MKTKFPAGWDEARVRGVLSHYEQQSEDEAVAEDEATARTFMEVPRKLVPAVRELIAKAGRTNRSTRRAEKPRARER
ncbi:MAG TPA: hypothetical protein VMW56_28560 [Candidatus Margulisiibacteriota bacterium]|nr:hypothetical protein [Candidatus Margulisiibacteriota bacterium]